MSPTILTPSRLDRLLIRWGASYLWRITLLIQSVALPSTLLGIYYIALNVSLTQTQLVHAIGAALTLVAIGVPLEGIYNYQSMPHARAALATWSKTLATGQVAAQRPTDETELEAWREITALPKRFARFALFISIFFVIMPATLYVRLVAGMSLAQFVHAIIGGILSAAGILVYDLFVMEWAMGPVRRILLPHSAIQQYAGLGGVRIQSRLLVVYVTLIVTTLLMVGTLGYQKAANALAPGIDPVANLRNLQVQLVIIGAVALSSSLGFSYLLARSVANPTHRLIQAMSKVEAGQLSQRAQVISTDELGQLTIAFNQMVDQLEVLQTSLEQQVAEHTRDLERRAMQLATSGEIARVATALLDPDQLIVNVVQLIQERFGCYYAGLFLIDAENRFAVLQYGVGTDTASEAGRIMKERGHRLEIGGQSMIGWACANQQARIALDVGQEAVRFANPLTPDTHSEMALPLRSGERVIGALTIQSAQTAAFDQDDINALQGMADQIAITLENARLFQQTQHVLKELEQANRLLVRERWQEYLGRAQAYQAEFRPAGIQTTSGKLPHILQIPLEQSGQKIGALVMERAADQPWSNEETQTIRAIVQQAVLAADNARLFEESQRLAARERLINEITARIRGSATLDGVLNTAVREISQVTGAILAAIELELPETDQAS